MRKLSAAGIVLLATAMPVTAFAQDRVPQPAPQEADEAEEAEGEEVVISGRLRGAVDSDIPPEIQLPPADIRALGVATIADLITELAPQTGSAQGRGGERPVVLLNGRRISGFSEIRDMPTEAIERVDILPEEVALKYGYRADQKVVNIVLRRRFRAITAEGEARVPTAGGFAGEKASVNILKISRDKRVNLDVQYNGSSGLLESERDLVSRPANGQAVDQTPYRTLIAPSQQLTINGTYSQNLSSKISGSLNALLEVNQRQALLGLDNQSLLLSRDTKSQTAHGGFSLNGDGLPWSNDWRWSLTGNYDRVSTQSLTGTGNSPTDTSNSISSVGALDALLRGPLVKLPAGDLSTSIRLGARTSDFDSASLRSGVRRVGAASRDSGSAQINLDLPIASRRREVLGFLGDLSLNANAEVERLSDFGSLVTTGYGVNWSPIKQVRFLASFTREEGAPSAQQIADPVTATPNVSVFDYVRGETAFVTSITGGNPGLIADSRQVTKLGLNIRPLAETDLSLRADYVSSITRNQISGFPASSAAVEAAFPGRFVRDGSGRLISVDNRAVNFASAERSQLRWGLNFSMPLTSALQKRMEERRAEFEKARAEAEANGTPLPERPRRQRGEGANVPGQQPQQGGFFGGGGRPGGGGGRGFGGGGRGMGGANAAGRINFSLYHTWHFKELVTIRDNLPVLDLLNGAATGSRGGQPRHEIEAQGGVSRDGLGFRLNAKWQSGTTVFTGAAGSGDRLDFGSTGTIGLRLFADLSQQRKLVREHNWLRGMRVTLSVDNLLDSHPRVTDRNGLVPISYQPDLLDPQGRILRLSIRKLFF